MEFTHEQLSKIYHSVGDRVGWDFSKIRMEQSPVPWHYPDVVCRFLSSPEHVLDIGTGGGEMFLSLASHFKKGIGIDANTTMIEQALRNKRTGGIENIDFKVMDCHQLEFGDEAFEVVLNRHCVVNVAEISRVLCPGGCFITQQVGNRNTLNLLNALGWTPESFGAGWWQTVEKLAAAFELCGCQVVARAEYDVRYWFCDVESLVFWLKAVPLPEPFDVKRHWEGVNRVLQEYATPKGIETNEHRELLIVEKR